MKKVYDLRVIIGRAIVGTIAHTDKLSKKRYMREASELKLEIEFKKTGSYTWSH